ncbi:MAG: metal-dependent hydrolase [Methylococcales bacterium]|nr:metal-dependent hydrolase [Methylococcales bacterium]
MMIEKLFKRVYPQQPAGLAIRPRKVDFGLDGAVPYNWYKESSVFLFLNAVTMLLPVGERFFINSVMYYKNRITEPVLQAQLSGFIAQEAAHGKQHELLNRLLLKDNPKLIVIEKIAKWLLDSGKLFPASFQLAITCALEHFTASFANILFENHAAFSRFSHPAVGELWAWHAVEELEHKAVCFDVYQAVAGGVLGYFERCLAMLVVTLMFSIAVSIGLFISIIFYKGPKNIVEHQGKRPDKVVKAENGNEWLWLAFNVVLRNIGYYLVYFRPFFHPWDCDNSHFVTAWKAAGSAGEVKNFEPEFDQQ